jgi:hypothetical protein
MATAVAIKKSNKSVFQQKGEMLEMLAQIKDKAQLDTLYSIMQKFLSSDDGIDWFDELPVEAQTRLDNALEEIKDENNLTPHDEIMKKYEKWLTK